MRVSPSRKAPGAKSAVVVAARHGRGISSSVGIAAADGAKVVVYGVGIRSRTKEESKFIAAPGNGSSDHGAGNCVAKEPANHVDAIGVGDEQTAGGAAGEFQSQTART